MYHVRHQRPWQPGPSAASSAESATELRLAPGAPNIAMGAVCRCTGDSIHQCSLDLPTATSRRPMGTTSHIAPDRPWSKQPLRLIHQCLSIEDGQNQSITC